MGNGGNRGEKGSPSRTPKKGGAPISKEDVRQAAQECESPFHTRSPHKTVEHETVHRRDKEAFVFAVAVTWHMEEAKEDEPAGFTTEVFFFETKEEAMQCNKVASYTEKTGKHAKNLINARLFTRKENEWTGGGLIDCDFTHNISNFTFERGPVAGRPLKELTAAVQAEFDNLEERVAVTVGMYPKLDFSAIQPGDVLVMNTNGVPIPGKLIAPRSPAGKLGLKHTALCLDAPVQGSDGKTAKGGGALTWEMFEFSGCRIRPMQGAERTKEEFPEGKEWKEEYKEPYPVEENMAMIIRYVGPDRERAVERVQEVIRLWDKKKANIKFPSYSNLYVKNTISHGMGFANKPDKNARGYAEHVRAAMSSEGDDTDSLFPNDPVQYCSSLVCATWQGALGSLAEEASSPEETELLNRLPLHAQWAKPSDWTLLPNRSAHWEIIGIFTGFSEKRSFNWYK